MCEGCKWYIIDEKYCKKFFINFSNGCNNHELKESDYLKGD